MKFYKKVDAAEIDYSCTKKQKKWAKKQAHKAFRRASKEAIRVGEADLAPKWGKFNGWVH